MAPMVLILPGWHNSGPTHWQSVWEAQYGYQRVHQHNWDWPLRGDWLAQLETAVLQTPHCVLVAHSLACIQVAAWAAHSNNTHRVRGALLVAPSDVERLEMQHMLPGWSPIVRERLPFASTLVVSRDDPHCSYMRASALALSWGSRLVDVGARGHINAESNLGDWPQGQALLNEFILEEKAHHGD
jgi:predicted alpha/beta hydrolase family esterase